MKDVPVTTEIQHRLILCVEDEDDLRSDLVEELEEAGYAVIEACNGRQAIEQLDAIRPDLILCDISMPEGNGYTLLESLRRDRPQLADVPFVFLTALADPREVVEGKRRGADDYLVKPVDFDLMLATIEARLRQVASIRQYVSDEVGRLRGAFSDLGVSPGTSTYNNAHNNARDTVYRTLDYISLGIVVLDTELKVTFANRTARALAASRDGITIGPTLVIDDGQASKLLQKGLTDLVLPHAPGADQSTCVSIPRPSRQRDLLAFAVPLEGANKVGTPAVVVFLADPEQRSSLPDDVLTNLFGLTPAESQVATLLAEGKRAERIAGQLGVSPTTVAFHIRNLLGKTGTHRQVDLIALLLAGPMALSFG